MSRPQAWRNELGAMAASGWYTAGMAGLVPLTLTRPAGFRQAMFRRFRVLVDGAEVGTIGRGETCSYQVGPGRHTVQVLLGRSGTRVTEVDAVRESGVALQVFPDRGWWRRRDSRFPFSSAGWLTVELVEESGRW